MTMLPLWLQALLWGGLTGSALIIGAASGYFIKLNQRVVGGIMAFGSGALISASSFELMEKAYISGGLYSTAFGFLFGAIFYSAANSFVSKKGARHRKRSNLNNNEEILDTERNGVAIAIGATIDGIPESIVIGLGIAQGGIISIAIVAAIFISNIPEGLSSSVGMKKNGRKFKYILTIWVTITIISSLASLSGYLFFQGAGTGTISFVMAIAAGGILAMIADTMVPEAFEETHNFAGLITVIGFLIAFMLSNY